eukprot:c10301_g1_i1.p1 GENE.c10301_g1_i1~~c10301_g1_i1.p1  ORF type:complete len:160 (-),score=35.80 c10301_g1_i1:208-687(-)
MLGFYGMTLVDENSGTVERSELWKERFENLNYYSHNYLRITRILKCLGEMGFENLKAPWIKILTHEVLEHRTISNAEDSLVEFWIPTLKDETQRTEAIDLARELRKKFKKHPQEAGYSNSDGYGHMFGIRPKTEPKVENETQNQHLQQDQQQKQQHQQQ